MSKNQSLLELLERTHEIKKHLNNGELSLIEKELFSIFKELKELTNPDEIETALEILSDGTSLLEEKFSQIQQFIINLTNRNQIIKFLKTEPKEELLNSIITAVWMNPFILPGISNHYLYQSWKRLVKHKSLNKPTPYIPLPKSHQEKPVIEYLQENNFFDKKMQQLYNQISPILPASLEEILKNEPTKSQYFEKFTLILHLLQENYLVYSKESKKFYPRENEEGLKKNE